MTTPVGPQTAAGRAIYDIKYREAGEDFRETVNRVAFGLKDDDRHYHQLRELMLPMGFLVGGRIMAAIGARRQTTAYNCFVSGTIEDTFCSGPGSIMGRAHEAAATMRMGGGIGYDFSTLRPSGSPIRKIGGIASGPVGFMGIFDAVCRATTSAGFRRGAQMGMLRVDHPDVELFIHAKNNTTDLTGFNLSLAITDEFMRAVETDAEFDLRFNGEVHRTINARELWERIMRSTWDYGEPGVIFIDNVNRMNNLYYCEVIAATNPCGEQPLPPYGACLLGSHNLTRFTTRNAASPTGWQFSLDDLLDGVPAIVRAMDNVIDRARYPLAEHRGEAITKRRMGLGVTGLANVAEALGYPYGSRAFLDFEDLVLRELRDATYRASIDLAREKGPFPLFDAERYLAGQFVQTLPDDVHAEISRHGIRNSHLLSIAPTGTISLLADNVSSSIEPVLMHEAERSVETPEGKVPMLVQDYGVHAFGVRGKLSADVTAREHVDVLTHAQRWIDSAVSKTCNVDGRMPWAEFQEIYFNAWRRGAKGCTTYNADGKRGSIFKAPADATEVASAGPACVVMADGTRSCE